jgi:outer membrane protein TolC
VITDAGVQATHAPKREDESVESLRARVVQLEASLKKVTEERDKLRRAYEQLKEHLELLRRRIFVAKAERVDVAQLELEFATTKAALEKLAKELDEKLAAADAEDGGDEPAAPPPAGPAKPKGRRNLGSAPMIAMGQG